MYDPRVPGYGSQSQQGYYQNPGGEMYGADVTQYDTPQSMARTTQPYQDGRNVQQARQPNPTSYHQQPPSTSQPHVYSQPPQQQYQAPYQAQPAQQQYSYAQLQPQRYYSQQPYQQPPPQGYYQQAQSQPSHHQIPDSRPTYTQTIDSQTQHRTAAPLQQPAAPVSQIPYHSSPTRPTERPQHASRATRPSPAVSTPQHRTVAHVQIPVQRNAVAPASMSMPRPAKKRRSNEGEAVPVCDPAILQKPPAAGRVKRESVDSDTIAVASKPQPPGSPAYVDYQSSLLALADEYVTAAYQLSSTIASSGFQNEEVEQYHLFIATAMGCLESVLRNYRQPNARAEARIRLRLATLLHEETENSEQAEEVLTKGITLCERNRLTDLKYAMHHLLVRVLAKGNFKAATKAVEKLIAEAEALKLVHWVYTFRFLRVSLGLQVLGHTETAAVLKQFAAITAIADYRHDVTVQILVATLEAMVHLRSGVADAVELAERALAGARMHQLSPDMQRCYQLRAMVDCLDLACALMQHQPKRIVEKMGQMQQHVDQTKHDPNWTQYTSTFVVPLGSTDSVGIKADTAGILTETAGGETGLTFDWLHRRQLYALAYMLSSVASAYEKKGESKTEGYCQGALDLVRLDAGDKVVGPLQSMVDYAEWQVTASAMGLLHSAAWQCARSEWDAACKTLDEVATAVEGYETVLDTFTQALVVYMRAVCQQGSGDLEAAEALYGSAELTWDSKSREVGALRDMQAVAGINRVQILRHFGRIDEANDLLASIQPFATANGNKSITSAYYVAKAAAQGPRSPVIKLKQDLECAVKAAQSVSNTHILCVVMSMMTNMFFTNIVGEQAVKAARASRTLARSVQSKLWHAVADKMYGDTLDLCGAPRDGDKARAEAERMMRTMPEAMIKKFVDV
ncbi:hypothetical protein LTR56_000488 [Elasticomyces elasticus]|nr:hypothetical protein LTR22_014216 [Elasticomyces elasticus]KAK3660730.1 hypothetical protein LTR56_000488 [Elasticomyces elasticus]KAK4922876.1 hypothetical protein LTR49_009883 [Elasticomyces elasticus]KAK5759748.1 hypothetical protein LTS12_010088 [Elasticomyces elasticus]